MDVNLVSTSRSAGTPTCSQPPIISYEAPDAPPSSIARVNSPILVLEGSKSMAKRKPSRFSATKAVKANARRRVGQPKPAKVVDDAPRTGRRAKYKPKMDEMIERGE